MSSVHERLLSRSVAIALSAFLLCSAAFPQATADKAVGTVKSVSGNSVVLTTDGGSEVDITAAESARIVRATPGQSDLKNATPIQLSDIQAGDRIFARGQAGENNSLTASSVIVMKQSDISERQQRERDEWRRGVGGIVKAVNPAENTITLNNALASQGKPIVIHVTPQAQLLRYPPNSINFDDSKPGTLDQIKPGDQLNARGTKSADGSEFTAQAVVSGTFMNIGGTVISTDAPNNTVTLNDLTTKKPVVVKIGSDSQLRKLPPFVAMMIAMRLKGGPAGAAMAGGGQGQGVPQGGVMGAAASRGNASAGQSGTVGAPGGGSSPGMRGGPGGASGRGGSDFQQMLNRMPAVTLAELKKGDAVMVVATAGPEPVAIKLITGVEPILSAAPAGTNAAATVLSPWNLGQSAGAGEAAAGQ